MDVFARNVSKTKFHSHPQHHFGPRPPTYYAINVLDPSCLD